MLHAEVVEEGAVAEEDLVGACDGGGDEEADLVAGSEGALLGAGGEFDRAAGNVVADGGVCGAGWLAPYCAARGGHCR